MDIKHTIILRLCLAATMLFATLQAHSQETVLPDSTLHLPTLNSLGQMQPTISSWPVGYVGMSNWQLHEGLNLSLGASVFTSFGKGWKGTGFSQQVGGMYATALSPKLSLAVGGYFHNADWAGFNAREAGLNAVMSYQFSLRWEGFVYGQKSLLGNKLPVPVYDHELGDRIGAAVRYHFNPSTWIQVSIETGKHPSYYY